MLPFDIISCEKDRELIGCEGGGLNLEGLVVEQGEAQRRGEALQVVTWRKLIFIRRIHPTGSEENETFEITSLLMGGRRLSNSKGLNLNFSKYKQALLDEFRKI